jgi:hypothetical protein
VDGPVVLASCDDALLPAPRPGVGTSFAGGADTLGTVDAPSFDAAEPEAHAPDAEAAADEDRSWSSYGSFGTSDEIEAAPPVPNWDDLPAPPSFADPEPALAEASAGGEDDEPAAHDDSGEQADESSDRGSLLKFLSTVKP